MTDSLDKDFLQTINSILLTEAKLKPKVLKKDSETPSVNPPTEPKVETPRSEAEIQAAANEDADYYKNKSKNIADATAKAYEILKAKEASKNPSPSVKASAKQQEYEDLLKQTGGIAPSVIYANIQRAKQEREANKGNLESTIKNVVNPPTETTSKSKTKIKPVSTVTPKKPAVKTPKEPESNEDPILKGFQDMRQKEIEKASTTPSFVGPPLRFGKIEKTEVPTKPIKPSIESPLKGSARLKELRQAAAELQRRESGNLSGAGKGTEIQTPPSKLASFKEFIKGKAKEIGGEIKSRTIRDIPKLQAAYGKVKEKGKEIGGEIKSRTIRDIPKLQAAYEKTKEKLKELPSDIGISASVIKDMSKDAIKSLIKKHQKTQFSNDIQTGLMSPYRFAKGILKGHANHNDLEHQKYYQSNKEQIDKHLVELNKKKDQPEPVNTPTETNSSKGKYKVVIKHNKGNSTHIVNANDHEHAMDLALDEANNNKLQNPEVVSVHDDKGKEYSNKFSGGQPPKGKEYTLQYFRQNYGFTKKGKHSKGYKSLETHKFFADDHNSAVDYIKKHFTHPDIELKNLFDEEGKGREIKYETPTATQTKQATKEVAKEALKPHVVKIHHRRGVLGNKNVITPVIVNAKDSLEAKKQALEIAKQEGWNNPKTGDIWEKGKEHNYSATFGYMKQGLFGPKLVTSTVQTSHAHERGALQDAEMKFRKEHKISSSTPIKLQYIHRI